MKVPGLPNHKASDLPVEVAGVALFWVLAMKSYGGAKGVENVKMENCQGGL